MYTENTFKSQWLTCIKTLLDHSEMLEIWSGQVVVDNLWLKLAYERHIKDISVFFGGVYHLSSYSPFCSLHNL